MSTNTSQLATIPNEEALFAAVAQGDLSSLTRQQQLAYYIRRCNDLGLNPMNQPFQWLKLNGKLVLYANRQCSEELRKVNGVSIHKLEKVKMDDLYVVTAYARDKHGREDAATGAVSLATLKGEALANAMMKAETKAKRRVTLSICGLGLLDENEVADIPEVRNRMEKMAQADYEAQHAAVLARCEEPQALPPAEEEQSQEAYEEHISEDTRKKLFAACKQYKIPNDDLKVYIKESFNVESTTELTPVMMPQLIAWIEQVGEAPAK